MTSELGHKRHCSFLVALPLERVFGGDELPCCEDTQAILGKAPCGEEGKLPINSQ